MLINRGMGLECESSKLPGNGCETWGGAGRVGQGGAGRVGWGQKGGAGGVRWGGARAIPELSRNCPAAVPPLDAVSAPQHHSVPSQTAGSLQRPWPVSFRASICHSWSLHAGLGVFCSAILSCFCCSGHKPYSVLPLC